MKRKLFAIGITVLALMLLTSALGEALPPLETRPTGSGYQPAFEGQTRAPGMRTETKYMVDILTDALDSPWGMDVLPDGRLIISEKGGSMRIYDAQQELSPPHYGLRPGGGRGSGRPA